MIVSIFRSFRIGPDSGNAGIQVMVDMCNGLHMLRQETRTFLRRDSCVLLTLFLILNDLKPLRPLWSS